MTVNGASDNQYAPHVLMKMTCFIQLRTTKLENVAIANALQLEAARRRAVPPRFRFVAHAKFEVAQPIRCRLRAFLLVIRYFCCDLEL